jgi:hypothetical protein
MRNALDKLYKDIDFLSPLNKVMGWKEEQVEGGVGVVSTATEGRVLSAWWIWWYVGGTEIRLLCPHHTSLFCHDTDVWAV